ncbi:hypothetical protein FRC18_002515 [Serendipita sp. 400]|nr:hypothetical protein FRC18_002515 [Serendipita sp. 400]
MSGKIGGRKHKRKEKPLASTEASSTVSHTDPTGHIDNQQSTSQPITPIYTVPRSEPDHATSTKAYRGASDVAEQFLAIVKELSESTELISPLKSACALMIRGIQTLRHVQENQIAWVDLCEDMTFHLSQLKEQGDLLQKSKNTTDIDCLDALEDYLRSTAQVISTAENALRRTKSGIPAFIHAGSAQKEKEEISRQREILMNAWQVYNTAMKRFLFGEVHQIQRDLQTLAIQPSDDYGVAELNYALAYGDNVGTCEDGTREEILAIVREWASDLSTQRQIFWLNDAAGTGKSTIAATMAKEWLATRRLAGRFFFSPNSDMTQTTKLFCMAVAKDLASNQPSIAHGIGEAISRIPDNQHIWFDVQLQQLIIEPLRKLPPDPIILVIDALDSCTIREERENLLDGFIRHIPWCRISRCF